MNCFSLQRYSEFNELQMRSKIHAKASSKALWQKSSGKKFFEIPEQKWHQVNHGKWHHINHGKWEHKFTGVDAKGCKKSQASMSEADLEDWKREMAQALHTVCAR